MTAHMIVRSTVPDADVRDSFNRWYGENHMPQAIAEFHPLRCWRSWSKIDPSVHYAFYEFSSIDDLNNVMNSDVFKEMVDDFTRTWAGKVTRERDAVLSVQLVEG